MCYFKRLFKVLFFLFDSRALGPLWCQCNVLCDTEVSDCSLIILDFFRPFEYVLFVHHFNIFLNISFQFSPCPNFPSSTVFWVCTGLNDPVTITSSPFQKRESSWYLHRPHDKYTSNPVCRVK
jgi:hypothetical protein